MDITQQTGNADDAWLTFLRTSRKAVR